MFLKENVKVQGFRPEALIAVMVAKSVYQEEGIPFTITSMLDGKHSSTSLHYAGCAFDIRTRIIPEDKQPIIANKIRERLTVDYDVVLEKTHIHIEYQPRYK